MITQIINYTSLLTKSQRQTVKYRLPLTPWLVRQTETGESMTWSLDYMLQCLFTRWKATSNCREFGFNSFFFFYTYFPQITFPMLSQKSPTPWVLFLTLRRLSVWLSQGDLLFYALWGHQAHTWCTDIHANTSYTYRNKTCKNRRGGKSLWPHHFEGREAWGTSVQSYAWLHSELDASYNRVSCLGPSPSTMWRSPMLPNSSSRESDVFLWPPWAPSAQVLTGTTLNT